MGGGELSTEVRTDSEGGRRNLNQVIFALQVQSAIAEMEVSFGLAPPPKLCPQELGRATLLGWTPGSLVTHLDHGGHSGDCGWQLRGAGLKPPTLLSPEPSH